MAATALSFKDGGALEENHFYIERPADEQLPTALLRGDFCYVLAPRQMGKSSLRYRVARRLSAQGIGCATVDLTGIGTATVTIAEWYFGLTDEIANQIGGEMLRSHAEDFWISNESLSPVQRFQRFLRDVLLAHHDGLVVLFLDEVDAVRALPFSSDDFFAALRATYNARPDDPAFKRLRICLLGVAQPGDLIRNEQITPFNIGTRIDLADFDRPQLDVMAPGLASTGGEPRRLLDEIFKFTHGHPYMTQRLCATLVPGGMAPVRVVPGEEAQQVHALVDKMFLQRSESRDANLSYAEKSIQKTDRDPRIPKMLDLYGRLLREEWIPVDGRDEVQGALQLTGMVAVRAAPQGRVLQVRNRIFATVFDAAWVRARQSDRLLAEPMARWLDSGRNDSFVLRGDALHGAMQWAELRDDITADEQQFLRACWKVSKDEQQARAEAAQASEAVARAEAEAARHARAEDLARTQAAQAAEAVARAEAMAALAERERATASAKLQVRTRTIWLLALTACTLLLALGITFWQYRKANLNRQEADRNAQQWKDAQKKEKQRAEGEKVAKEALARQTVELADARDVASKRAESESIAKNSAQFALRAAEASRAVAVTEGARAQESAVREKQAREQAEETARTQMSLRAMAQSMQPGQILQALVTGLSALSQEKAAGRMRPQSAEGLAAAVYQAIPSKPLEGGHMGHVYCAVFSPDGANVVTVGADGTIRMWNEESGKPLRTFQNPSHQEISREGRFVYGCSVMFAPDGRRLVTSAADGTVRIYDTTSGTMTQEFRAGAFPVFSAAFLQNGRYVVTGGEDGIVRIFESKTGQKSREFRAHAFPIYSLSVSADGTKLATASEDGTARIWDLNGKGPTRTLKGHTGPVQAVAFSPDGRHVATASADLTARIWDVDDERALITFSGHSRLIQDVTFSPDGKQVMTASWDHTAAIFDAENGYRLWTLEGHASSVHSARFSFDGQKAVTASSDGTPRIWQIRGKRALVTLLGHTGSIRSATFSPDGARIVTASVDGTARLFEAQRGAPIAMLGSGNRDCHPDEVRSATFSPDGRRIITASQHTACVFDIDSGTLAFRLDGHEGPVHYAAFSHDGKLILTASGDRTARIWRAGDGFLLHTVTGHAGSIFSAAMSPDGQYIATASSDRTIRIWRPDSNKGWQEYAQLQREDWAPLTLFSPDGSQLLTAGWDSKILLYDVLSLQKNTPRYALGPFTGELRVSFSPKHATQLAVASDDRVVRVWDYRAGQSLFALPRYRAEIRSVAFSPDSRRLVVGSDDHTAQVYMIDPDELFRLGCQILSTWGKVKGVNAEHLTKLHSICTEDSNEPRGKP